jgi:hypothetical protein
MTLKLIRGPKVMLHLPALFIGCPPGILIIIVLKVLCVKSTVRILSRFEFLHQ